MSIKRRDRVLLPGEAHAVTVQGVDRDEESDEGIVFFQRLDGVESKLILPLADFDDLTPLRATGSGDPRLALAGLWGFWLQHVTASLRQTVVATTPLTAYAHQDEAVFGEMLPQPALRFLLADEPGTGKTIMTGMYIAEMRRLGLLGRTLLVVPAHLLAKWERDLTRFFGLQTERLTAEVGKSHAPLHPNRDIWLVSVDLLARNQQVQRKAIFANDAAWDLVVFDEAHRLTPTAQAAFPAAIELAKRCTHLLLLTATPHRGSEYLFRALLHLLDPAVYPWQEGDRRLLDDHGPRLRPARIHFLRRMKEQLKDHDNVTPLFPPRRAHNVAIPLSATEQELYDAALDYCDRFFDDASGLVRSVYGKRGASSLAALDATLKRRSERLRGRSSDSGRLFPPLDPIDLGDEDADPEIVEECAIAVRSMNTSAELSAIAALRARLTGALADSTATSAKWRHVRDNILPPHGIAPGNGEQLLIFTEFADTARWLEVVFRDRGFSTRRYAGDVPRDEREQIQADFQERAFQVLISTDAGNEGIDLQSAHVLINWDIPWSIVRLEQRAGRLHRVGQRSRVDIYNLIASTTREGRVQEVILNNIVAAANALNGQIFDFLGSVVDALNVDYLGLLLRAGSGGSATDAAVAEARRVTADQYRRVAEEQRSLENELASDPAHAFASFLAHGQQDRLDAVNPAVVTAFMQILADARDWTLAPAQDDVYLLRANGPARLPAPLGGKSQATVAMSAQALAQARRFGAELARAIVLGPAEEPYRALIAAIVRDAEGVLAAAAILEDDSALTPYELIVYDATLLRKQGSRPIEQTTPVLVRIDAAGARVISWPSVTHLRVPVGETPAVAFPPTSLMQAEDATTAELDRLAAALAAALRTRTAAVEAQLDHLLTDIIDSYQGLPLPELRRQRSIVRAAIAERKTVLQAATGVSVRGPRLVGRVQVLAGASSGATRTDSDSEVQAMRACALLLEADGFHVVDVHQEGCGYDLRAIRHHEVRCVEVKGLRGDISPGIMLESSEWLMAQQHRDDYWVFVFVNCATTATLFGAYRNPVAVFGHEHRLVQRFHVLGSALRKAATA